MNILSILTKIFLAIFAISLVVLFSLIIVVAVPDVVLAALGYISLASGIITLVLWLIRKQG